MVPDKKQRVMEFLDDLCKADITIECYEGFFLSPAEIKEKIEHHKKDEALVYKKVETMYDAWLRAKSGP